MRKLQGVLLAFLLIGSLLVLGQATPVVSQPAVVNRLLFFTDNKPVEITLLTDFKKMQTAKEKGVYQNSTVTVRFSPESEGITEDIRLYARGEFRRKNCFMPSIMLNFKNPTSPKLSDLKKIKLVCGCSFSATDEQLLLKEYLIYKIYNLLTDMSFKVRLAKIDYKDSRSKVKEYSQFAFMIEDATDMAKRNSCKEIKKTRFLTEQTDRNQMTLAAIFQYMIGNTDWAIPVYHNIKLIQPLSDSTVRPYVVPYDFDFAGLVNAYYAAPSPELGIERVTERNYRGYPRTMEELQTTLDLFRKQKDNIFTLVNNFEYLKKKDRETFLKYIEEFYELIENKNRVKDAFINKARTE